MRTACDAGRARIAHHSLYYAHSVPLAAQAPHRRVLDAPGPPGEAEAEYTVAQTREVTQVAKHARRGDQVERRRWQQWRPHQRRATAAAAEAALACSTTVAVFQAAGSAMKVLTPLPADVA